MILDLTFPRTFHIASRNGNTSHNHGTSVNTKTLTLRFYQCFR